MKERISREDIVRLYNIEVTFFDDLRRLSTTLLTFIMTNFRILNALQIGITTLK